LRSSRLYVCLSVCLCVCVCMAVCLSVRSHVSKTKCSNFTKFSVHVRLWPCSVLISRPCNTLCTSGFVDDVIFHITQKYRYRPLANYSLRLARGRQGRRLFSTIGLSAFGKLNEIGYKIEKSLTRTCCSTCCPHWRHSYDYRFGRLRTTQLHDEVYEMVGTRGVCTSG